LAPSMHRRRLAASDVLDECQEATKAGAFNRNGIKP
jgi:hypothetical protein